MRPVFSRSGRAAVVTLRSAGISGATKRALKSLVKKPPSAKNRRCGWLLSIRGRPLHRRQRVERFVRQRFQCADVEIPAAGILERRQCRVLAEHVGHRAEIERRAKTEPFCNFGHDPPIRLGLTGGSEKRALPRDPAFRIGHRAGFLAPGLRRQQHMRARVHRVVGTHILRNHEQFELFQRGAGGVGIRQRHRGIGADHPQRLDLAAGDRLEHLDRLQSFMRGDARRLPEPAHAVDVGRREAHMGGELVGEPADLASAHRIGLPGQRERRRAGLADPPGREMAVDDGIDLVGALRRLVDALRIQRHHARRGGEHPEELGDIALGKAGRQSGGTDAAGDGRAPAPAPRRKPPVCRSM